MPQFGDKFRNARESKELSLDDVSNVTKISARMLQAIEQEHFDQLPGGVFNRGFIRAYAKHLGLDSEDAVNDYLECLRQAQIDSHQGWDAEKTAPPALASSKSAVAVSPKPPVKVHAPVEPAPVEEELPDLQLPRAEHVRSARKEYLGPPASGSAWIMVALAVIIVIASSILWIRHSRSSRTASTSSNSPVVTASAASSPVSASGQSSAPLQQAAAPVVSAKAPPHSATSANQPAPQTVATRATTPAPLTPVADVNQVRIEKKGDVTIRSFGSPITKPVEKALPSLTLIIRAVENSWVSVTSDGQLVTQETLIAPAHTTARGNREIVARIGNAAGVVFTWNGREIAAQGAEGEVKTFVFDAQGMHAAPTPQVPPPNESQ